MAPAQSCPDIPSVKHDKALNKTFSTCHQGLTPSDSPTTGSVTPQATVEDLKHLFENVLLDLTNREPPNTPVFQDNSQPGPDMGELKQLLVKFIRDEYSSGGSVSATKPAQYSFAINEQEVNAHAVDVIDLKTPICTTPDDFKSFEKWASSPEFKSVVETYGQHPPSHFLLEAG